MVRWREVLSAAAAVALLGCGDSSPPKRADDAAVAATDAAQASGPRLVLLVVIDQLPSWRFETDEPKLTGGLRRLIDNGLYVPKAEFPYAATYTAPGHAALCTGGSPDTTGILANGWWDRDTKIKVGAVADPTFPVFWLAPGKPPADYDGSGASGRKLQVEGIGDALRRQTNDKGKAIAVGLKQRAAVVALGKKPNLAIWYDAAQQALTTSRWYAGEPPAWLARLAADKPVSRFLGQTWRPSDKSQLAELAGGKDDSPGEGKNYGLDTTFPHSLADTQEAAKAVRATPWGTQIVIDGALAAIDGEQLGEDDVPDLLALTISSHDYAGHYWGQESWERIELLLDLDKRLGTLLEELDRRFGKDGYAVVVSSDHGAAPLVETSVASGHKARRVRVTDIMAAANKAAGGVLGTGKWFDAYAASTLYVSDTFRTKPADKQKQALDAVVAAVAKLDGIGFTGRCDQLAGNCDERDGMEALACRSIRLGQSGDIFVGPERYSHTTTTYFTGTSHGTASDEDRIVPIIVAGPGVTKQRRTERTSMLQVAPTLAKLLGIDPPEAALDEPLL